MGAIVIRRGFGALPARAQGLKPGFETGEFPNWGTVFGGPYNKGPTI